MARTKTTRSVVPGELSSESESNSGANGRSNPRSDRAFQKDVRLHERGPRGIQTDRARAVTADRLRDNCAAIQTSRTAGSERSTRCSRQIRGRDAPLDHSASCSLPRSDRTTPAPERVPAPYLPVLEA